MESKEQEKTYLGFVRISAGSSWYQGKHEPELIALKTVKVAKRDWSSLYKFKKEGEWLIAIYDVTNCKHGWQATTYGMFPITKAGKISKRKLKYVKSVKLYV
jgi:hypothetical protein